MPLISPTPFPTPPISPVASSTSLSALRSPSLANVPSNAQASGSKLRLVDRRFGDLGRSARTEDVFQKVVYSGGSQAGSKGKGKAIGDVWLDGQTVSISQQVGFQGRQS